MKKNKFDNKQTRQQPFILLIAELFFIVFSIHITGFDGLFTLRNLAMGVVIVVAIFFFRRKSMLNINTRREDLNWVLNSSIFFLYSIALVLINNAPLSDTHNVLRSTFNFQIMVVVLPFFLLRMEKRVDRFALALTIATTIHAIIVLGSFLSPVFNAYLYAIQAWEDDFLFYRVCGLGIAGAGGSVYLFCGFLANCYYLLFCRRHVLCFVSLIIIIFSTMLVGRTGFYMEVGVMAYSLWRMSNLKTKKTGRMVTLLSIISSAVIIIAAVGVLERNISVENEKLSYSYNRLDDILEGETLEKIQSMRVPELNATTLFFGTGMTKGRSFDGVRIWNDSGYVQRFHGFGLVPAIISYLILFIYLWKLLWKIIDKEKRRFLIISIVLMFIIDYKEAFIFYLALPFVLILFLKLELYEQKTNQLEVIHRLS